MDIDQFIKELLKAYADQKLLIQAYHETIFAVLEFNKPGQMSPEVLTNIVNDIRNITPSEIENIKTIHKMIQKYAYMNPGKLYEMDNLVPNCRIILPGEIPKSPMGDYISNIIKAEMCINDVLRKLSREINSGEIIQTLQSIIISHEKHIVRLRRLWDQVEYLGIDIT